MAEADQRPGPTPAPEGEEEAHPFESTLSFDREELRRHLSGLSQPAPPARVDPPAAPPAMALTPAPPSGVAPPPVPIDPADALPLGSTMALGAAAHLGVQPATPFEQNVSGVPAPIPPTPLLASSPLDLDDSSTWAAAVPPPTPALVPIARTAPAPAYHAEAPLLEITPSRIPDVPPEYMSPQRPYVPPVRPYVPPARPGPASPREKMTFGAHFLAAMAEFERPGGGA